MKTAFEHKKESEEHVEAATRAWEENAPDYAAHLLSVAQVHATLALAGETGRMVERLRSIEGL